MNLNLKLSISSLNSRKTHNQGVFDVYTPDILRCRKSGVITGLPDAYGRGRIGGDYRQLSRMANFLMKDKFEAIYFITSSFREAEKIFKLQFNYVKKLQSNIVRGKN